MFHRWIAAWRRVRRQRAAEHLQAWISSLDRILDACSQTLRAPPSRPDDRGAALDRVDLELVRCRNHAAAARRQLRSTLPPAADKLKNLTDGAFELRNRYLSLLIRWGALLESQPFLRGMDVDERRAVDEARLLVSRSIRELTSEVKALSDQLRPILQAWKCNS